MKRSALVKKREASIVAERCVNTVRPSESTSSLLVYIENQGRYWCE